MAEDADKAALQAAAIDVQRVVIIGNAGSGKSVLAKCLADLHGIPAIDLDEIHWSGERYGARRDEDAAKQLVATAAAQERWIVEGVYGWLAREALPRATAFIWLDLSWEECRAGLFARGLRQGMSDDDHHALVQWAADYWIRDNSNSWGGHHRIYEAFDREKTKLFSRADADRFVEVPMPSRR